MGLLDDFLEVGGTADGITPTLSFAGAALGWSKQLTVPLDLAFDVDFFLQSHGFQTFNSLIVGDMYCFDVARVHYKMVLQLLCQEFELEPG